MADGFRDAARALRAARPLSLARDAVLRCVDPADPDRPTDPLFARAFTESLAALDPSERRGALAGIAGHVAESVVEVVLGEHGWSPVWHFTGPGRHGVDLLLLGPGAERLFAVEVKGTLRPRRWPRLRRTELAQMELGWLDKADNPGMSEWGVVGADVYGAVVLVNFADLAYKVVLTTDFTSWHPIGAADLPDGLDWLDAAPRARAARAAPA